MSIEHPGICPGREGVRRRSSGKRAALLSRSASTTKSSPALADQLSACQHYADAQGLSVVRTYSYTGVAGAGGQRPDSDALLKDASEGSFDILVVRDLARLSRSSQHLSELFGDLAKLSVEVHVVRSGPVAARQVSVEHAYRTDWFARKAACVRRANAALKHASPDGGQHA